MLTGSRDEVVLPESLVGDLMTKVGDIAEAMDETFSALAEQRDEIRRRLLQDGRIAPNVISPDATTGLVALAIDGASLVEIDRATSYGISCVARVGPDQTYSAFESNMFVLPHLTNIDSLASGFMMMQELMMACETAEQNPDSIVMIDGSKVTFVIKIISSMPLSAKKTRDIISKNGGRPAIVPKRRRSFGNSKARIGSKISSDYRISSVS